MRVRLLRRRYFLWLVILPANWLALQIYGPPHVIFEYTYTAQRGMLYDPNGFDLRLYHTCTYFGVDAKFRKVAAQNDWCPFVRFFRLDAPVLETRG